MFITKEGIIDKKRNGELIINPILDKDAQFEGAKIDLRLDNTFYRVENQFEGIQDTLHRPREIREKITVPYSREDEANKFILHPGEFALASTFEHVAIPADLVGLLGGRSSIARQGIIIHATAGVIDPGYTGTITLELSNIGNIPTVLNPRQRIASIMFAELNEKTERYTGAMGDESAAAPKEKDEDADILEDMSI